MVEPRLVDKDQIILVGFSFFGDPFKFSGGWSEENEIGRLWKRFMAYLQEAGHPISSVKAGGGFYDCTSITRKWSALVNMKSSSG